MTMYVYLKPGSYRVLRKIDEQVSPTVTSASVEKPKRVAAKNPSPKKSTSLGRKP